MADFYQSVSATLLNEGGYINDPSDSGGETYEGISRHSFPNWEGWKQIDACRPFLTFPKCLDVDYDLKGMVVSFYKANFWHFDGIASQPIADKIFDLSVNVGELHCMIITQRACGVRVDGVYGPTTEAAINATSNGSLLTKIKASAVRYHEEIVDSNPRDAKFLKGWIERDDK